MQKFKKTALYSLLIIFVIVISKLTVFADPGDLPGGDGGCDPFNPTDCPVPLDTWVYFLVAAALYFAYRHIKKQQVNIA